ncbi:hypothetical protein HUU05_24365 [candidate division KSB1 bacterium]|nr:hypothetical protein [candidate division KSB1 bacterium]
MSEYQYYEFQSLDRPLTEKERAEIGSWSSRTTPTSTQAIFTYSYGDFPRDEKKAVEKYFDAMLYLSSWGGKRLMFRLPRALVEAKALQPYCSFGDVTLSTTKNHLLLDIFFDDEEGRGGWLEGEGWLSSLIALRNDLINGDLRMLYLAWLHSLNREYEIEEQAQELEPPVPLGLKSLNAALKSFIDFFEIDGDLIAVASRASAEKPSKAELDWERAVAKLSKKEQSDFLVRLAKGEHNLNQSILKRLRELSSNKPASFTLQKGSRTVGELLREAREFAEQKEEKRQHKERQEKIARVNALVAQEPELWNKVLQRINLRKPKAYDEAVSILKQLREAAEHLEQVDRFNAKIAQLQRDHSTLFGLKSRLKRAGLGSNSAGRR